MFLEKSFEVRLTLPIILERVRGYFGKCGYRETNSTDKSLEFKRGSRSGAWGSFNPTTYECKVTVSLEKHFDYLKVLELFEINVSSRNMTEDDRIFWWSELDTLEDFIQDPTMEILDAREIGNKIGKSRMASIIIHLVFMMLGMIVSAVILSIIARK